MAIEMDVDEIDVEENSQNESDEDRDDTQLDENSENADDDDQDDDDDDDDDEDEDEDEDDEDDDEDDEDDDDDDADNEINSQKPRSPTPAVNSSPAAYVRACENRLKKIQNSSYSLSGPDVPAYLIEPVGAAPHSAHVHAMALSADGTNLITGGSDGYVRRYDVYASMNGKAPLTQNVRHQFVDGVVKGGAMTAWWACEESEPVKRETEDDDDEQEVFVSPVHSLAIQQDALWCLSGTESGNINLYSLRHDTGHIRHILRRHTSAVSAMVLTKSDTELLSGGWDRSLHQWDLNTGQVVRSFPGHTGQITSISIRPLQQGETWSNPPSPNIIIRPSAANGEDSQTSVKEEISEIKPTPAQHDSSNGNPVLSQTLETQNEDISMQEEGKDANANGITDTNNTKTPDTSKVVASGSSPSKKSAEDSSLFGEDGDMGQGMDTENGLSETLGLGTTKAVDPEKQQNMMDVTMDETEDLKPTQPDAKENEKTGDDSDGDSLFGGMSADGSADADGEADVDAEGEKDAEGDAEDMDAEGEDDDAEGEDDDAPLAARAAARPVQTPNINTNGLELPGSQKIDKPDQINGHTATTVPSRQRQMPKPAFGGASTFASFDGDVSKFSNDIMLTTTLGGQVTLWDKRVPSYPGSSSTYNSGQSVTSNGVNSSGPSYKGVRALALPDKTPPWCMSACWNSRGDKIYVGRRNETVDEWDLRMLPDVDQAMDDHSAVRLRRGDARFLRSIRLPPGSGPVSSVLGMPNSRHLICGSYDNVRIWDTMADTNTGLGSGGNIPFRIVAGHHGATVSQTLLDPTSRFLFTSSGDRGWMSTSTEAVILHEVRSATW